MNNNLHPNLQQRSLSVNPWVLIVMCLLPVSIGSTYFIQEHRYQTGVTEKVALQSELSKAKDDLQNTQTQISKNNTQIESANQEIERLKAQLDNTRKETQELRNKLTFANNTAKAFSAQIGTQKLVFTKCMTQVQHIVETTQPLYQKIHGKGVLKSMSTLSQSLKALGEFSELHTVWNSEACQTSQELFLIQVNE